MRSRFQASSAVLPWRRCAPATPRCLAPPPSARSAQLLRPTGVLAPAAAASSLRPARRHCASSAVASAEDEDEEAAQRRALGERAHREVQIARRRRREAEDEAVLFKSAAAAGFVDDADDAVAEGVTDASAAAGLDAAAASAREAAARRRRPIDRYVTAQAQTLFDAVASRRPLTDVIDFELEVAPSKDLPQPIAGDGVFVKSASRGEIPAGTVLAFYPGSVYMPHEVRWLGGYGPTLERAGQTTSSHVIGRVGGVRIDGLWSSLEVPAAEYQLPDSAAMDAAVERMKINGEEGQLAARADVEAFCEGLRGRTSSPAPAPVPQHQGLPEEVRRLNPLAVGEMINHPPNGEAANVLGWPVDLDFADAERARAAPNAYALRPEGAAAPGAPCPYTVVMVAARTLRPGDELYLDYGCELLPVEDIPVWFTPARLHGYAGDGLDTKENPATAIRDELHAWRDEFLRSRGRRANRHDLLADPVAAALFETFQGYRKLGDL
eukprot:TRINITY_DN74555_c0_g1_i1.p1 TRINITY_DN74555_c0_g1~~TRINITY_DN74555_c0_g1_i1.p1  ORF type:complete len:495 (+),score=109.38 TRINITY_DN74555_c0_g1_i1:154-1638(+)